MKTKNLFRTLLAVMIAVVMSFAVFAFAACGPGSEDPNKDTNIPPEKIDDILDTDYAAIELVGTVGVKGSANGTANVNGKINLDGTADVTFHQVGDTENYAYMFMRDWAVYGYFSEEEVAADGFAELDSENFMGLADLSESIDDILEGIAGSELPEGTGLVDVVKGGVDGLNGALLKAANAAGAVSEKNGVVTLDINKAIYNVVRDVKGVVSSLNGSTTIGDILGNKAVKNYGGLITEFIGTPEELIEAVAALLGGFGAGAPATTDDYDYPETDESDMMYMLVLSILGEVFEEVTPDANSTAYDYIVKVLSSDELKNAINEAFKDMGAPTDILTKKVTEFTLSELLAMVDPDMSVSEYVSLANSFIDTYTSGVKVDSFSVTIEDVTPFVLSNAKILYTYGKNGLTSQKIEAKLVVNQFTAAGSAYAADSSNTITSEAADNVTLDVDLTFNYKATAYAEDAFVTLPDLSDVEFGGDIEEGFSNPTTLYYGENEVSIPAGGYVSFEVSVNTDIERLHIYTDGLDLTLMSVSGYGPDITIYNLSEEDEGPLTLVVANSNENWGAHAHIYIEEAEDEGADLPALTLNKAEPFTVDYGGVLYQLEVTEAGYYELTYNVDESDLNDLFVLVGTDYEVDFFGDVGIMDEIQPDQEGYYFEEGTVYILVYSSKMDGPDWVDISGTITVSRVQA